MVGPLTLLCRERGMTSLQAVLLLGAGFLVVWGLMELFEGNKGTARANTALTLRGEFKRPAGGAARAPGGGNGGAEPADGNGPTGPGKLPGEAEEPLESPETLFEVPGHGRVTDREINELQKQDEIDRLWDAWKRGEVSAGAIIAAGGAESDGWPAFFIRGLLGAEGSFGVQLGRIENEAYKFSRLHGRTAGEINALRHTYWQTRLAYEYGGGRGSSDRRRPRNPTGLW